MNKSKIRGLQWNLKKLRGSVLHFTQNKNWLLIDGKKKINIRIRIKTPEFIKYLLWHVTCISGSIASPKENAVIPRALKALKVLREELPCKL